MDDSTVLVAQQQLKPIKILKWKVQAGCMVSVGSVILLYEFDGAQAAERRRMKSSQAGIVFELAAPEGAIVPVGEPLLRLRRCMHPTVMNDMCADCGADLRKEEASQTASASVPMVHSIPELKVSEEVARKLGQADTERLIRDRKLVLLVDLDQTLIHTTNDNIPANIKDVYHFQLYGPPSPWYHTRLRPGTHSFLSNISQLFELHICTFGARNYAHMIATLLDNDQTYFANRILSRDECFDPTSKKANLKALFPCGDNMVCIIDDREDVWNHASNLIHVKPYHFFQHTGDINAPPGLDKPECDNKDGVDLSKLAETQLNGKNEHGAGEERPNGVVKSSAKEEPVLNTTNGECTSEKVAGAGETCKEEEATETKTGQTPETKTDDGMADNVEGTPAAPEKVQTEAEDAAETRSEASKAGEPTPVDAPKKDADPVNKYGTQKEKQEKDDLIVIEDPDDYLLYLEDVLKLVHQRFYEAYDKLEAGQVPDLKVVIPAVRSEILRDCRLVFSGLVANHIKLEQSRAYQLACSLGAVVTQDIGDDTTHLVAVRPGTAKVNAGRRRKNLKIVTPDWLWACAERWERIEEAIFPLSSKGSRNRHPPPHCSSPEHVPSYPTHEQPAARKRTPSGRFMDTINPLMSFSQDDIADMDKEVEDMLDDEDDESESDNANDGDNEGENETDGEVRATATDSQLPAIRDEDSSSSAESLSEETPRGHKRARDGDSPEEVGDEVSLDADVDGESTIDDCPSAKFRRGEALPSDLDVGQETNSDDLQDEADDGEWNMMGAALEREFLSNN